MALDSGSWVIAWIGPIAKDASIGYCLKVAMYRLEKTPGDYTLRNVPLALLPYLAVGSVWDNGHHTGFVEGRETVSAEIVVQAGGQAFCRLADWGGSLSGLTEKRGDLVDSSLLIIDTEGANTGFVCPSLEILRSFYSRDRFVVSSLLTRAFDHSADRIFNKRMSRPDSNGMPYVQLRKDAKDESARLCYWLAYSQNVRRSASAIYDTLMRTRSAYKHGFPDVGIPCIGRVLVEGEGCWEQREGRDYLVMHRLDRIGFPVPDFRFRRENAPPVRGNASDGTLGPFHVIQAHMEDVVSLVSDRTSRKITRVHLAAPLPEIIPDDAKVVKSEEEDPADSAGSTSRHAESVRDTSVNRPTHRDSQVASAVISGSQYEDSESDHPRLPATFESFQEILEALVSKGDMTVTNRTLDAAGDTALFPVEKNTPIRSWSVGQVIRPATKTKHAEVLPRKCMIAELRGTFGYRYLMEIERLEDERRGYCMGGFRADDARALTDKELKYLLRQCGMKYGVWPSKVMTFRHAYKSLENAVKAIRSRLIEVGD